MRLNIVHKSKFSSPRTVLQTVAKRTWLWLVVGLLAGATACLVEQPKGVKQQGIVTEPVTKSLFQIYLPAGYDASQRYPLVIILHGLNPYDTWDGQVLAWESTADQYKMVVVAPKLKTTEPLCPIPPGTDYEPLQTDARNIVAIRDYVVRNYSIDPRRILVTSWSAGGYVANYVVSRYPSKFTALALWGSNWHEPLVNLTTFASARDMPIWVGWGANDFQLADIPTGSRKAAAFYRGSGFTRVQEYEEPGLGHLRRPNLVAGFFLNATRSRGGPSDVQILASANIGFAPLTVSFTAKLPTDAPSDANYLWLFGSERTVVSSEPSVTKVMDKPGHYPVEVMISAGGGTQHYQATTEVTVLPPPAHDAPQPMGG